MVPKRPRYHPPPRPRAVPSPAASPPRNLWQVSGSPVSERDGNRYQMTLAAGPGGATRTGMVHYCCSPCVCDSQATLFGALSLSKTSCNEYIL
jgi:hypothetical protein